jgi:hypothetical protein
MCDRWVTCACNEDCMGLQLPLCSATAVALSLNRQLNLQQCTATGQPRKLHAGSLQSTHRICADQPTEPQNTQINDSPTKGHPLGANKRHMGITNQRSRHNRNDDARSSRRARSKLVIRLGSQLDYLQNQPPTTKQSDSNLIPI